MTTKEIAEITGLSRQTVNKMIKRLFPALSKSGKATVLNREQAEKVIGELRIEGKRNITPAKNERVPAKNEQLITKQDIAGIVKETVTEVIKSVIPVIQEMAVQQAKQQANTSYLPLPAKEPTAEVNQIVRSYAKNNGYDYGKTWRQLYTEFYYHFSIDVTVCAKNRGVSKMDYVRFIGKEKELLSVARKIFVGCAE